MEIITYGSFKNERWRRLLRNVALSGFSNLVSFFDANSSPRYFFGNNAVFVALIIIVLF